MSDAAVPDAAAWTTVFDVPALRIEVRPWTGRPVTQACWHVRMHAHSVPFAAWTEGDPLPEDDEAAAFVAGGHRAAELRASGGLANTGEVLWLVLRVTPNGDDPYPSLTMHMFEDRARVLARMPELDAVLGTG